MKQNRKYLLSVAFGCTALLALVLATESFQPTRAFGGLFTPVDTNKGPKLTVNELDHDFGKVEQQGSAEVTFMLSNTGTDTLEIMSANPSCGCTAAVIGMKRIGPGKVSTLKVTFDPHNKAEGGFTKTINIVSNSVIEPQKTLRIHGVIYHSKLAHKDMMHLDGVFQGNCGSCHVDKGKGELGAKLYEADCAICHGLKADNKPGPDIVSDDMMNHTPEQWKKIIGDGIANTNMPQFHKRNKGPLADEEIASLVDYLSAFKKNLVRERMMKSGATTTPAGSN